jgi:hypothetical protein
MPRTNADDATEQLSHEGRRGLGGRGQTDHVEIKTSTNKRRKEPHSSWNEKEQKRNNTGQQRQTEKQYHIITKEDWNSLEMPKELRTAQVRKHNQQEREENSTGSSIVRDHRATADQSTSELGGRQKENAQASGNRKQHPK